MTIRVLNWVNKRRGELGLAPLEAMPKGTPGCDCRCPLARAFADAGRVSVTPENILIYDSRRYIDLPGYVVSAIKRFDAGKYPDLVA